MKREFPKCARKSLKIFFPLSVSLFHSRFGFLPFIYPVPPPSCFFDLGFLETGCEGREADGRDLGRLKGCAAKERGKRKERGKSRAHLLQTYLTICMSEILLLVD
jgi:hypothetical protein